MNAIVIPKPMVSKFFDRQRLVADALKPFADSASCARCGPPKSEDTSDRMFDEQAALDRVEGNRELLRNMVVVFSMHWRERLAEIASAASRRDGAALELVADRLKQSLRSIGAGKASRLAQELGELGGQRSFHHSKKKHAELATEIERLAIALKEFSTEAILGGSR